MKKTTNYKGYNRSKVNGIVTTYILEAIPTSERIWDEWQILTENTKDRVNFVMSCFESEYNYDQNKKRWPNIQERLAQWLMGLPSAINIDFENYRIIELGKEWGYLPDTPATSEKKEDEFISRWFTSMAFRVIRLHEKLNKSK